FGKLEGRRGSIFSGDLEKKKFCLRPEETVSDWHISHDHLGHAKACVEEVTQPTDTGKPPDSAMGPFSRRSVVCREPSGLQIVAGFVDDLLSDNKSPFPTLCPMGVDAQLGKNSRCHREGLKEIFKPVVSWQLPSEFLVFVSNLRCKATEDEVTVVQFYLSGLTWKNQTLHSTTPPPIHHWAYCGGSVSLVRSRSMQRSQNKARPRRSEARRACSASGTPEHDAARFGSPSLPIRT
ncbi:hypothetical protein THAOC_12622, partial [Thalassiosira oceanica]